MQNPITLGQTSVIQSMSTRALSKPFTQRPVCPEVARWTVRCPPVHHPITEPSLRVDHPITWSTCLLVTIDGLKWKWTEVRAVISLSTSVWLVMEWFVWGGSPVIVINSWHLLPTYCSVQVLSPSTDICYCSFVSELNRMTVKVLAGMVLMKQLCHPSWVWHLQSITHLAVLHLTTEIWWIAASTKDLNSPKFLGFLFSSHSVLIL